MPPPWGDGASSFTSVRLFVHSSVNCYQSLLDLCMLDWFDIWSEAISVGVLPCLHFLGLTFIYLLFADTLIIFQCCKIWENEISRFYYVGLIYDFLSFCLNIRVSCAVSTFFRSVIFLLPGRGIHFLNVKHYYILVS